VLLSQRGEEPAHHCNTAYKLQALTTITFNKRRILEGNHKKKDDKRLHLPECVPDICATNISSIFRKPALIYKLNLEEAVLIHLCKGSGVDDVS
jgi:phosphatidylinositol kinase/protein kinase (PI-3  family)